MKYVLDASVALRWVLPETDSAKALALRHEYQRGLHLLIAPDVFPVEVAHALTRAERQGRLVAPHSQVLFADVLTTVPDLHQSLPYLPRAIELSSRH